MDKLNENLILPDRFPTDYTACHPNILMGAFQGLRMDTLKLYAEILNFNHKEEKTQLEYYIPYERFLSTENTSDYIRKHKTEIIEKIVEPIGRYTMKLSKKSLKILFPDDHNSMFMRIHPIDSETFYKDKLKIVLTTSFKKILIQSDLGFTKGDIEFVREIDYPPSFWMYWMIRKYQQYENKWEKKKSLLLDLDEIRTYLGLENKYPNWKDFKINILDRAENDFKNTWVEFTWKGINVNGTKGRGAKVTHVEFTFLKDIQKERLFKLNLKFEWEDKLIMSYGFKEYTVEKIIRTKIRAKSQIGEHNERFWDSDYVKFCIDIFEEKLSDNAKAMKRGKHIKPILNKAKFLYSAMLQGYWMDEVDKRRQKKSEISQLTIEGFNIDYKPFNKNPEKSSEPKRHETPIDVCHELYEAYLSSNPKRPLSLEEYIESVGYKIEGEVAVKYH